MIVETPVENSPPVIETIEIPEYARPFCDSWGNIKKEPVKTIEQTQGRDFIKINIFRADPGFFYGYQFKIKKLILQKEANINDVPFETEEKARRAARNELLSLVSEKKLLQTFISFDKVCYNQPELF
jgi:hypothetical protein